jgi:small subunit ribosomal protein S6e
MARWKFVVNDPGTKKSFQLEIDQNKALSLVGKKIGEEFEGEIIGLPGYKLKITGGTDRDGFPMHPSVPGMGRKRILLSSPPGFRPKKKGQRKRKMVRGNVISEDIAQINCKIVKKGEKPLEDLIPTKPKELKEIEAEKKEKEKKKEGGEEVKEKS